MAKEYTQEQLRKLYEKLPEELKEVIFSAETADNIWNTCEKNGIEIGKVSEVAELVGNVLLGLLPPEEFQTTLERELKLKKDVAKTVAQEINRFIFFPVKESLAVLYGKELIPIAGKTAPVAPKIKTEKESGERSGPLPEVSPKADTYREPIE